MNDHIAIPPLSPSDAAAAARTALPVRLPLLTAGGVGGGHDGGAPRGRGSAASASATVAVGGSGGEGGAPATVIPLAALPSVVAATHGVAGLGDGAGGGGSGGGGGGADDGPVGPVDAPPSRAAAAAAGVGGREWLPPGPDAELLAIAAAAGAAARGNTAAAEAASAGARAAAQGGGAAAAAAGEVSAGAAALGVGLGVGVDGGGVRAAAVLLARLGRGAAGRAAVLGAAAARNRAEIRMRGPRSAGGAGGGGGGGGGFVAWAVAEVDAAYASTLRGAVTGARDLAGTAGVVFALRAAVVRSGLHVLDEMGWLFEARLLWCLRGDVAAAVGRFRDTLVYERVPCISAAELASLLPTFYRKVRNDAAMTVGTKLLCMELGRFMNDALEPLLHVDGSVDALLRSCISHAVLADDEAFAAAYGAAAGLADPVRARLAAARRAAASGGGGVG
ncbi:hypothetical protein I4F81_003355 [Pyropia yezoensis]|uniref:Uncharacterized protein n=1 Tax=Pyropia yezoensis TaxID=2788 RepID=A0ACC3BS57_PYRYE|nr:hypothetical protein I4F81_003355 [Neopyropia yezoensis]